MYKVGNTGLATVELGLVEVLEMYSRKQISEAF